MHDNVRSHGSEDRRVLDNGKHTGIAMAYTITRLQSHRTRMGHARVMSYKEPGWSVDNPTKFHCDQLPQDEIQNLITSMKNRC